MIDSLVEILSGKFIVEHQPMLAENKGLDLDISWNSIYILDHITEVKNKSLPLAAYIGSVIYYQWIKIFPKNSVKLILVEEKSPKIILKVHDGFGLSNQNQLHVDVTHCLESFYKSKRTEVYALNHKIPSSLSLFPLTYLSFGLLTALNPNTFGKWQVDPNLDHFLFINECLSVVIEESLVNLNSINVAKNRLFNTTVYKPNLFPIPLGFEEKYLGMRSATHLVSLYNNKYLTLAEIKEFGSYLIYSNCISLASIGYCILLILDEGHFSNVVAEFSYTYPELTKELKPCYEFLAEKLNNQKSWHYYSKSKQPEVAEKILKTETNGGISPYLFCANLNLVHHKEYRAFFECISLSLLNKAILRGKSFDSSSPATILIQQSYLFLQIKDFHSALKLINSLNINALNQSEKICVEYLDIYIYLLENSISTNDIFQNRLLKVLESTEIDLNKRKELLELSILKLDKILSPEELISLFVNNDRLINIISLKGWQVLNLIKKQHQLPIQLNIDKKLTRCLWSQHNIISL